MHVKIRKRIGNPTLYNAKINYSLSLIIKKVQLCLFSGEYFRFVRKGKESMVRRIFDRLQNYIL